MNKELLKKNILTASPPSFNSRYPDSDSGSCISLIQHPRARKPHPATRTPQLATSISAEAESSLRSDRHRSAGRLSAAGRYALLYTALILLICITSASSAQAQISSNSREAFKETVQQLAALGDRSSGSSGNEEAAAYIKDRFSAFGFETVDSQKFEVVVVKGQKSSLTIPDRGITVPIRPLNGNAVTPETIAPPGLKGPLIYAGNGGFDDLKGKDIEGCIILMELDSGKNWLYVADLGAKALIYVDRGNSAKFFFEDKFELSPIQFPRRERAPCPEPLPRSRGWGKGSGVGAGEASSREPLLDAAEHLDDADGQAAAAPDRGRRSETPQGEDVEQRGNLRGAAPSDRVEAGLVTSRAPSTGLGGVQNCAQGSALELVAQDAGERRHERRTEDVQFQGDAVDVELVGVELRPCGEL